MEGWQVCVPPVAVSQLYPGVDRELAAGEERRALAGDRGQVRLRQGADDAGTFHRLQGGIDAIIEDALQIRAWRRSGHPEWRRAVEVDDGGTGAERSVQIDAQLLEDVALDFGNRDLEHDLIAIAHRDRIDDLAAARRRFGGPDIEEPRRDIVGRLRLGRCLHRSGQDHAAGSDPVNANIGVREHLLQHSADAVEIPAHRQVETGDLLAGGIEKIDVGLPHRGTDDVGAPR